MCSLRMSVINVQNSIYFVKIRNKFRSFHICQKFISEKMKQQLYLGHQWFGIPVLFCCYAVLAQVTCFCEIKNPFWPMRKKNKWREGWCDGTGHCVQCVILNENVQSFLEYFWTYFLECTKNLHCLSKSLKVFRLKAAILGLWFVNLVMLIMYKYRLFILYQMLVKVWTSIDNSQNKFGWIWE